MEFSLKDLKEFLSDDTKKSNSFVVGEKYLFRCVTFYYTGRIISITDNDLVLEDAAWIANTGRFGNCLKSGEFDEIEPFENPVIVPLGTIVDATKWEHNLPRNQK